MQAPEQNDKPANPSNDTPSSLLKSWYLARLRNLSRNADIRMTPATLVQADRGNIEQLILSGVKPSLRKYTFSSRTVGLAQAVVTLTTVLSLLMVAVTFSVPHIVPEQLVLAVLVLIGTTVMLYLIVAKLAAPLKTTGTALSNATESNIVTLNELSNAVEQLARSRDEAQSGQLLIADSAPALLLSTDTNAQIVACNNRFSESLMFTKEDLLGKGLERFILPEDARQLKTALESARSGTIPPATEARLVARNGTALDIRWQVEWSDRANGWFLLGDDVSAAKRLERARLEFISTMGHDIKIPLSSVWSALQIILQANQEELKSEHRETIARAENNVERLIGLIDELLEYERTESGRLLLRTDMVSSHDVCEAAVSSVAQQAEQKHVSIEIRGADVMVQCDESKITRVITNLLSNAVKFSPENTEVLVSCTPAGDHIEFSIEDQGEGIPPAYQTLIFERYERLPQDRDVPGTGLGLSICKSIVESHSGLIGVTNTANGGSRFWFRIPVRRN